MNDFIIKLFKKLSLLKEEEKKKFASSLNKLKNDFTNLINKKFSEFESQEINKN